MGEDVEVIGELGSGEETEVMLASSSTSKLKKIKKSSGKQPRNGEFLHWTTLHAKTYIFHATENYRRASRYFSPDSVVALHISLKPVVWVKVPSNLVLPSLCLGRLLLLVSCMLDTCVLLLA